MNDPRSSNSDPKPALETGDEFDSGKTNRLHGILFRFLKWLFHPPYFPSALTGLLLALTATDVAVNLYRQPREYWIDPAESLDTSALGVGLSRGPWNFLLIYAGYSLLIILCAAFLNRRLVFPAWAALALMEISGIAASFSCGMSYKFSFINETLCSQTHTTALVIGGLIWAGCLAGAATLGVIPLVSDPQKRDRASGSRLPAALWIGSSAWIILLGVGIVFAAGQPQPEWSRILPAHSPSARMQAATTYDPIRLRAVLFGGADAWFPATDWNEKDDTWEWDGADWTELAPADRPSPRRAAAMAYDEMRNVTVLFGGAGRDASGQPVYYDDTWEWDGRNWVNRPSKNPPRGRSNANLFYDASRGKVVLYAGYYQDQYGQSAFLEDAWEWDGRAWDPIPLGESRVNSGAALVYYPGRQVPVLIDGEGLWFLKDLRWYQPNFPRMPRGRWQSQMALNLDTQLIILFGGYKDEERLDDTWVFNGSSWKRIVTRVTPAGRYGHCLFFDGTRKTIVLFGGNDGISLHQDMWELKQP